jgi:hypothetical protein
MTIFDQIENGVICINNKDDKRVDILFAGDLYLGKRCEELCRNKEYDKIYGNSISILRDKHISVVNLESPLTNKKNPIIKDGPHLLADPSCIETLKYGNFDVAALANNHILDHGSEGLKDTIDLCCKTGIKTVGAGSNKSEAGKPLIVEINSTKVGFLNFTENEFSIAKENHAGACGIDLIYNYDQIIKLRNEVDVVIVIIHGGNELYPLPNPQMVKTYRFFADLGVTAIVGHHSHCASGLEVYKGVPIFYSLGNFIFDSENERNDLWYTGYIVKLSISANSVSMITLHPYEQFKSSIGLKILEGRERISFLRKIKEYSDIIQDTHLLFDRWKSFCLENENFYLATLLGLNRVERALFRRGIGKKLFMRNAALVKMLNQIRCEAHREASMQIIQSKIK